MGTYLLSIMGILTNLIMYVILLVKLVPAQRISLPDIGG